MGHGSYVSPFAFNDTHILLPVYPRTGRLAALYDHKGKVEQFVGEIFPIDKEMLREIPALNDTLWAGDDSGWYCLFRYRPFIYRFDKNLKKVAAYRLSGPEIDACEYDLFEEEIPKNRSTRPEHFTDFKLHGEYLYLLCRGVLYQIDKHTGHWRNRVSFYGKGADFEETGLSPTERLNMTYMAFLDDGTMITAPPALMWNHDLWTVRLPFMK
ncbi:MAG: hypothetical protein QNK37_13420 [Acidobacteriota bacterium]|nr:hypothetical protein [Acidobacteriota bacterium]